MAKIEVRWKDSKRKAKSSPYYKARYTKYNDRTYIWKAEGKGSGRGAKPIDSFKTADIEMNIDGKGWR